MSPSGLLIWKFALGQFLNFVRAAASPDSLKIQVIYTKTLWELAVVRVGGRVSKHWILPTKVIDKGILSVATIRGKQDFIFDSARISCSLETQCAPMPVDPQAAQVWDEIYKTLYESLSRLRKLLENGPK